VARLKPTASSSRTAGRAVNGGYFRTLLANGECCGVVLVGGVAVFRSCTAALARQGWTRHAPAKLTRRVTWCRWVCKPGWAGIGARWCGGRAGALTRWALCRAEVCGCHRLWTFPSEGTRVAHGADNPELLNTVALSTGESNSFRNAELSGGRIGMSQIGLSNCAVSVACWPKPWHASWTGLPRNDLLQCGYRRSWQATTAGYRRLLVRRFVVWSGRVLLFFRNSQK
jgi:hypothetical protein